MQTADRNDAHPSEGRVLRMLERIEQAAGAYESSVDEHEPVTEDEVQAYRSTRAEVRR